MGKAFSTFVLHIIDSPQVVENIPPVRITFPDGINIMSDYGDIDNNLSKTFDREVRLMKASSLEKSIYEEYWPDIDGLAQRQKVTDETMPSQTFFDIAVIHLLTTATINRLRELYQKDALRSNGPFSRVSGLKMVLDKVLYLAIFYIKIG